MFLRIIGRGGILHRCSVESNPGNRQKEKQQQLFAFSSLNKLDNALRIQKPTIYFRRTIWVYSKSPARILNHITFTYTILSLFMCVCVCVRVCAGECFVRRPRLPDYIWSSLAFVVWHTLGHGFVLCYKNCDCSLPADVQHDSLERFSG